MITQMTRFEQKKSVSGKTGLIHQASSNGNCEILRLFYTKVGIKNVVPRRLLINLLSPFVV